MEISFFCDTIFNLYFFVLFKHEDLDKKQFFLC